MQRFENKTTKNKTLENDDQFSARLNWFNNDFPSYDENDRQINASYKGYSNHTAQKYGWTDIKKEYTNLKEKGKRRRLLSRKKERQEEFSDFEDEDVKNQSYLLKGYDKLCLMAFIVLDVLENHDDLIIPEWLEPPIALNIIMKLPKTSKIVYNRALRDYNEPERITKNENEILDNTPKPLSEVFKNKETINILDSIEYNDE